MILRLTDEMSIDLLDVPSCKDRGVTMGVWDWVDQRSTFLLSDVGYLREGGELVDESLGSPTDVDLVIDPEGLDLGRGLGGEEGENSGLGLLGVGNEVGSHLSDLGGSGGKGLGLDGRENGLVPVKGEENVKGLDIPGSELRSEARFQVGGGGRGKGNECREEDEDLHSDSDLQVGGRDVD
jgi:hypothetical protein